MALRKYRVLVNDGEGWSDSGVYEAHSADAACRAHVAAIPTLAGAPIVAVPDRNWSPITLKAIPAEVRYEVKPYRPPKAKESS